MSIEVGAKLQGKVSGITNFGAFIDLGEGKTGLVHISEISNGFVKDIHDVLTVGDEVTVKVTSVGDDGKLVFRFAKPKISHSQKRNLLNVSFVIIIAQNLRLRANHKIAANRTSIH